LLKYTYAFFVSRWWPVLPTQTMSKLTALYRGSLWRLNP